MSEKLWTIWGYFCWFVIVIYFAVCALFPDADTYSDNHADVIPFHEKYANIGTMPTFEPLENPSYDLSGISSQYQSNQEAATRIVFISYPNVAARNEEVTVRIKGAPNTRYTITVTYLSGPSTAEGLFAKTSNSDGYVSWTWKIGGRTTFGSYPITVSGNGDSETIYFQVSPS